MNKIKFNSVGVQAAIITGLFAVVAAVIYVVNSRTHIYTENKSLKQTIETLKEDNRKYTEEIQRLETQLIPFKTVALELYPGTEAEALSKLESRIYSLEKSIESVQDYAIVARYDSHGTYGGISFGQPTPDFKGCYTSFTAEDGKPYDTWKCDSKSVAKYRKAIEEFPTFPFSYALLAICLHNSDNVEWINYAQKARKMFLETTRIAGHDPMHDEFLEKITHLLKEKS